MYTRPLREEQAAAALGALAGVAVFYPELRRSGGGRVEREPLFPRYLFVRMRLAEVGVTRINTAHGVTGMVSFDEAPLSLPEGVVEALQERVEQINRAGGAASLPYVAGDRVVLRGGPLRGLEAVFQGPLSASTRARVLVEFLGQPREVEVDARMIKPSPERGRSRGTRGGGRRVAGAGREGRSEHSSAR